MERQGDEVHLETDEARGGSTPNIVRWILIVGLIAAIVVLSATWIIGALNTEEQGTIATATDRIAEQTEESGTDTDSIVSDGFTEIEGAAPAPEGTPGAGGSEPGTVTN